MSDQREDGPRSGFRFLLQDEGRPFRPSRCYVVADPTVNDRRAWTLELDPPEATPWVYVLDDVKSWMLHGEKPVRQMFFDSTDPLTPFRELERSEVFREYLRKQLERLPDEHRESRKFALMPSIAEKKTRDRYKDALEAAIPGVTVVPEPEMVAEYFRLLERTLELERGENNVVLVVDVGASTANMTVILSRRDRTIVDIAAKGDQRDLRVRALRGDSARNAGCWVDSKLVEVLSVPDALLEADRAGVLRAVEEAKLRCSRTEKPAEVAVPSPEGPLVVDRNMLASLSEALWKELHPLFRGLCVRLYENQTSSEHAKSKSEVRFGERKVAGPDDAHRLIDVVLLAGGTSLLPRFQEAMLDQLFPDASPPPVLRVEETYPIAAAAGGLAHVLHRYDPPRLRPPEGVASPAFDASFDSTLPFPLVLGVKRRGELEDAAVVLDPDDPFVDDGGRKEIEGISVLARDSMPKMRLVPGGASGVSARRGRRFEPKRIKRAPGRMEIEWDVDRQRATVHSEEVEDTASTLWIDAHKLRLRKETAEAPFTGVIPEGALAVDGAEDVVLDVGMSKIVALGVIPGWVSAAWLKRTVRDGLSEDERIEERTDKAPDELDDLVQDEGPPDGDQLGPEETEEPGAGGADVEEASPVAESSPVVETSVEPPAETPSPGEGVTNDPDDRGSGQVEDHSDKFEWSARVSDQEFTHALEALRVAADEARLNFKLDDLVVALLALAVRPVVLLAGPPGCGKSTLVRVIAHVLGRTRGQTFHEIAVQAHWEDDEALFGKVGLLREALAANGRSHLLLFDEINLTRPEFFLSRFFHAVEDGRGFVAPDLSIAPCRAFGTLNIDDTSRPPSPKVVDRCFLLELGQVTWDIDRPTGLGDLAPLPVLPGLPAISFAGAKTDERVDGVLTALHDAVEEHHLRHDILPSRRVLADIRALLGLHHRLDLQATGLLRRDDLVDRIVASRILVKLAGAFEQIQPALDAVEAAVDGMEELTRTRRRLRLARQQARLGFVSPWQ